MDEPTIEHVNADFNSYLPGRNAIVLDSKLREYPKAHALVWKHEKGHAEIGEDFFGQLIHELRHDLNMAFGDGEQVRELRAYFRNEETWDVRAQLVFAIRSLWQPYTLSLGWMYRKVRKIWK